MPWLGPRARLYRGLLQDLIRVAREDLANFINTERITGHRLVDKRLLSVEELTKHTQRLKEEFRGIPEEYFEGIKEIKALTQADFERAGKFVYGTAEPGRGIIRIDPYSVLDQEGIVMHEVLHMLFPNVPESKIRNLTREALKKIGLVLGIWGLGILTPEQAEAAPLGPIRRVTRRVLEGPLSPDATRILKGKIIKGKVVKEVRRGRGDWRYIVFEDGTHLPVDKSYIRSAAAGYGRERYIEMFERAPVHEKAEMIRKSLERRLEQERLAFRGRATIDAQLIDYERKLRELGIPTTEKSVLIRYRGRTFSIPETYARILERATRGKVRILKRQPRIPLLMPALPYYPTMEVPQ